ncbi:hypothetical protein SVAN01_11036 [Stagonosporopsis vannaccii]|nr:hypothetical protein SVAN01_11036 [Stagonosporopsis vannaccii]
MKSLWYSLPGELRNRIYEWCLLHENYAIRHVRHFPRGFRCCRSKRKGTACSNFPSSYWGFTQVNRQIRAEFTPWLLKRRRVKTPLATLNAYVEVFHPKLPDVGDRIGWIEPMKTKFSRIAIPAEGIEVLSLLMHNHLDRDFHLELRAEYPVISIYRRDEVDILHRLSRKIDWDGELHKACGITSMVLLPYEERPWGTHVTVPHFVVRPSIKHRPMVRLICKPTCTADGRPRTATQQRWCLVYWLFYESRLAYYQDFYIHACLNGYEAMWKVNMPGFIVGKWERLADGRIVLREYWLLRVTETSPSGHQMTTIKEMLPP